MFLEIAGGLTGLCPTKVCFVMENLGTVLFTTYLACIAPSANKLDVISLTFLVL